MSKKVRFIWVRWLDAAITDYWATKQELGQSEVVECVGFFVKETPDILVLALQKDSGNRYKEALEIPKFLIQKRRWLQ